MKPAALAQLPNWPASMDVATAVLYLGGKPSLLAFLRERGWLKPVREGHANTSFRRIDIDAALAIAYNEKNQEEEEASSPH